MHVLSNLSNCVKSYGHLRVILVFLPQALTVPASGKLTVRVRPFNGTCWVVGRKTFVISGNS